MGQPGGGGGDQNITTNPPAFQKPFIEAGLNEAAQLYNKGAPAQYSGQTVVPFAGQTEQALQLQQNRALSGSPVTSAAQNYVTGLFNGGGAANPYLDQQFQHVAQMTQPQLESEFARSGRNLNAAIPARADMLASLAGTIYGPAIQQQQALTAGLVPYANQLANQDYTDIGQLRNVGGQVEGLAGQYQQDAQRRFDYANQAPQQNLDAFLQRATTGNYGSSQQVKNTGGGGDILSQILGFGTAVLPLVL
jgi:hypothetical protein